MDILKKNDLVCLEYTETKERLKGYLWICKDPEFIECDEPYVQEIVSLPTPKVALLYIPSNYYFSRASKRDIEYYENIQKIKVIL